MRENGFDYPLHPLQCLTWALFPVILLDFYWLLLPLLPGEATRWAVGTVYTAAAATTFFCAWITAAVDPRDPSVAAAAPPATNRLARCCEPLALWPPPVGEDTCRCYLCQVHVFASSKHCRFCDKCVLRFDHHCKWLNTHASARPGAWSSLWRRLVLCEPSRAHRFRAAVRAYEEFRDMARTTGSSGTSAEQEIAAGIRKYFSENPNPKYAGVWHCFVGRNFGAFFTHETGSHIYFYEGQTAVNLFKTA